MWSAWADLRYGLRMLVRSPGFAVVAVVSLAIGIGANSAIFSWADALLLRPLPVARPGELLTVGSLATLDAFNISTLDSSYPDYLDIRATSRSFNSLAAFRYVTAGVAPDSKATPKLSMGLLVSDNFFSVMGLQPNPGRPFRSDEHKVPGRDAVVVLGNKFWEQDFGADQGVLGRKIRINGVEFTVVGVAPPGFTGMDQFVRADFMVPLMMKGRLIADPRAGSLDVRDSRDLTIKGRLRPGVGQTAAQSELTSIAANLEHAYPETNKNRKLVVRTELQDRVAQSPPDAVLIAMLATLALAVLFVACANVAGLLASRAPVRAREIALRLAIGAGRVRVVRQLLTESLVIAVVGGVLGLGIGYAGITLFRQVEIPSDLPIALTFTMDRRALAFSLTVSVASAVIFGLVPALQATRNELTTVIKMGEGPAPGGRRRWGRATLVGGQVAISVVLLVIALFIYRGFRVQLVAGPGYRTDHLLLMRFDPSMLGYSEDQSRRFFKDLVDRARAVPGVTNVTLTTTVPMANGTLGTTSVAPEGFVFPPGKDSTAVLSSKIDESYFDTIGIGILRGRSFTPDDGPNTRRVAIVNEQFARHYWPGQDALGRRIRVVEGDPGWVEIVGIAKMSKYVFIAESPTDFLYLPYRQARPRPTTMVAQSTGDPASLVGPLRDMVRGLDANLFPFDVRTMSELYRMRAVSVFKVLVTTVLALGVMGLALAIVGLYGLVAYAASRRTREIGIRMAIGADRAVVLRMILRQGFVLSVVGLVVGLAASIGVGRLLRAAFPAGGMGPLQNAQRDFMALIVVIPIVLAVTSLAAYIPARRAARVSPVEALRYE